MSWGESSQSSRVAVHGAFQKDFTEVDIKYGLSLGECGEVDSNLSVKPARSQQCLVQNIHAICGGKDYHSLYRVNTCIMGVRS